MILLPGDGENVKVKDVSKPIKILKYVKYGY